MTALDLPPETGVLLAAHGTRNEQGLRECGQLAERVAAELPAGRFELAYLELAAPELQVGIERLAQQGVRRLLVAPLLLFAAGHAKRDIPQAVAQAAEPHGMQFEMAPHLGCHPAMLALSARRYEEALAGRDSVPAAETTLVMVGRGSRDDSATAEMQAFTRQRTERTPVGRAETAFLAMAEPRLAATLQRLAQESPRRVVVQPHLLFTGDLLGGCQRQVEAMADAAPHIEWIVAGHLEPDALLAEAVLARIATALELPTFA